MVTPISDCSLTIFGRFSLRFCLRYFQSIGLQYVLSNIMTHCVVSHPRLLISLQYFGCLGGDFHSWLDFLINIGLCFYLAYKYLCSTSFSAIVSRSSSSHLHYSIRPFFLSSFFLFSVFHHFSPFFSCSSSMSPHQLGDYDEAAGVGMRCVDLSYPGSDLLPLFVVQYI